MIGLFGQDSKYPFDPYGLTWVQVLVSNWKYSQKYWSEPPRPLIENESPRSVDIDREKPVQIG